MKKHNEWTKRTTLLRRVLLILVSFLLIGVDINASYSLRQFSSKNGLSNSAILSMCQDRSEERRVGKEFMRWAEYLRRHLSGIVQTNQCAP